MLVYELFDLYHRNVFAATNDDIFDPTGDSNVAVGIDTRQIARVEPAVGVDAVPLRPFQVAHEIRCTPNFKSSLHVRRKPAPVLVGHADLHPVDRTPVGLES